MPGLFPRRLRQRQFWKDYITNCLQYWTIEIQFGIKRISRPEIVGQKVPKSAKAPGFPNE